MTKKIYKRRTLVSYYTTYARAKQWIDNRIAVEAVVDVWLEQGCCVMDDAISFCERSRLRRRLTRNRVATVAAVLIGVVVLIS